MSPIELSWTAKKEIRVIRIRNTNDEKEKRAKRNTNNKIKK